MDPCHQWCTGCDITQVITLSCQLVNYSQLWFLINVPYKTGGWDSSQTCHVTKSCVLIGGKRVLKAVYYFIEVNQHQDGNQCVDLQSLVVNYYYLVSGAWEELVETARAKLRAVDGHSERGQRR